MILAPACAYTISAMDIVRDESVKKRKRQKQTAMIVVAVIAVLGATLGVSRLKPALQSVDGWNHLAGHGQTRLNAAAGPRPGIVGANSGRCTSNPSGD